jgi:GMP synthase (glutamine-hydrolysing)
MSIKHIAILDFGSQYTHLIARNIRELGVLAKIYPTDVPSERLEDAAGVILSGGPQAVYVENSLTIDPAILELGVPVLGVCYGHQLLAHLLGGQVDSGKTKEYGKARLAILKNSPIFENISGSTPVWMSHGDTVVSSPAGFEIIGATDDCPVTAMADEARKFYGFQFHPEVAHTQEGKTMLSNFVLDICQAEKNWRVENLVDDLLEKIKKQVGGKKVFILMSGGVDSNVAFALLTRALGPDRVLGLYIDTGFMRQGESAEIKQGFARAGFRNIRTVDASADFYAKLENVYEPEAKRKIIGQTFLEVKDKISRELELNPEEWLLGQGTIYPDTIESGGTKNADKIKTHHNRVDAIAEMIEKGLVVEPLVDFYKDEVRALGKLLGLPVDLINRHPFPGPGLAIRTLCRKVDQEENLAPVEKKVEEFIHKNFKNISGCVLPIRSVGVQGDNRTYAHPLVIWGELDWQKLGEISAAVTNSLPEINRVLRLLNPGEKNEFFAPGEDVCLTRERVDKLRRIDAIVNRHIRAAGIYASIWQFPVVLIPVLDKKHRESIVLRPINSRDAMTLDFFQMDKELLEKITRDILATGEIGYVFYDLTDKPPGTVEWE